ncbi:hypothetical protein CFPU101_40110 [Chroococcus sp. FPU101]|nr:hypothetical protein CFPU101_40110 [Chroococcus sp. FPU101]
MVWDERGIERVTGIHHTTVMHWVKEAGIQITEDRDEPPNFAQLDELKPSSGKKVIKSGSGQL